MKVLVIQPKIGIGDMVIYLPYIHAISKRYKTPVSILVKENARASELLIDDINIDEILILDRKKNKSGLHDGVSGFFRLIKEIKDKKFDKIFIFNGSLRYFLIAKLAGIKNISQYPFFRSKDNIVTSAKVFTEYELDTIVSTQPILYLKSEKIDLTKKEMSSSHKHICLGISASGPSKRWGINNYIKLCEKINDIYPSKFYLAGGKNDKSLIEEVLKSNIGLSCVSFDNFIIRNTLPIIKNCNLYIGNDTGWMHISSALGVKSLALFMDSPVMAYGKYSKNIFTIVPDGETEESTTHDTLGKDKISLDKVYNKSIKLLN